jgi:recombination protein RecT
MNTATPQSQSKQLTVVDTIRKLEPEFKLALPAHIPAEKFTRVAVTAVNSNPDLLKEDIDKRSLLGAVTKAAQDGLILDGREAALVVFKTKEGKKVQYLPMVAGVLKKMRNSGEISNISYGLVYRKEYDAGRFKYIKGDTESLTHDPILFEDKGDMIGVYAVVTLKDGAKVREFMDMQQLKKVQATSKTGDSEYGPWKKWFEEMCVKSVLKKVSKLCPQSSDIDQVMREDDDGDDWTPATISAIDPGEAAAERVAARKVQTRAAKAVKEAAGAAPAGEAEGAAETGNVVDAEFSTEEPVTPDPEPLGNDEPPM